MVQHFGNLDKTTSATLHELNVESVRERVQEWHQRSGPTHTHKVGELKFLTRKYKMSYSPRMLMFMHVYISETVQIQETST